MDIQQQLTEYHQLQCSVLLERLIEQAQYEGFDELETLSFIMLVALDAGWSVSELQNNLHDFHIEGFAGAELCFPDGVIGDKNKQALKRKVKPAQLAAYASLVLACYNTFIKQPPEVKVQVEVIYNGQKTDFNQISDDPKALETLRDAIASSITTVYEKSYEKSSVDHKPLIAKALIEQYVQHYAAPSPKNKPNENPYKRPILYALEPTKYDYD